MPKLAVIAAGEEEETPTPDAPSGRERKEWVLALEETPTGDGRIYAEGAFTWRDLPLPFMAVDRTTPMHMEAQLVANIVAIERRGNQIVGITEFIPSDDPDVLRLQKLIREDDLRGVSVDMDNIEGEMRISPDEEVGEDPATGEIIIPLSMPNERFTAARIIGATAVPFPAFAEASSASSDLWLVASGGLLDGEMTIEVGPHGKLALAPAQALDLNDDVALVTDALGDNDEALEALARIVSALPTPDEDEPAAEDDSGGDAASLVAGALTILDPPMAPPMSWFDPPNITHPTAGLDIDHDGRIQGYLALWETCHVGFQNECVLAPKSHSDYASFHGGRTPTAEGHIIRTGAITSGAGHAPLNATTAKAKEHYDHTGWAAADVRVGEDHNGIWIAGAIRPTASDEQVRELMGSKVSGDWRRINGALDLIAIASVNSPGFPTVRAAVTAGAVTALLAAGTDPCERPESEQRIADRIALTIGRHPSQVQALRDELAAKVGRDQASRRLALVDRVHG